MANYTISIEDILEMNKQQGESLDNLSDLCTIAKRALFNKCDLTVIDADYIDRFVTQFAIHYLDSEICCPSEFKWRIYLAGHVMENAELINSIFEQLEKQIFSDYDTRTVTTTINETVHDDGTIENDGTVTNVKTGDDTVKNTGTTANAKTGTETGAHTGTDTNVKSGDDTIKNTGTSLMPRLVLRQALIQVLTPRLRVVMILLSVQVRVQMVILELTRLVHSVRKVLQRLVLRFRGTQARIRIPSLVTRLMLVVKLVILRLRQITLIRLTLETTRLILQ